MTPAQEKYAKKLRQVVMIEAKGQGWDSEEAHEHFAEWGYGASLKELTIAQLNALLGLLRRIEDGQRDVPPQPAAPLPEIEPRHASAQGMATPKQIQYAGVLARRYAELRGIPADQAFGTWHDFISKYQKIDHIQFCTRRKATEVISIMERAFITTFGNQAFHDLTGHTWMYRGQRYRKYSKKPSRPKPKTQ